MELSVFHVTDSAVNSEPPIFNDLAKFSVRKKPFWHISGKLSKNRVYNEYVIIQVAEPNPYLAYLARLCSQTRLTFSNGPLASISCRIVSSRVASAPAIVKKWRQMSASVAVTSIREYDASKIFRSSM